MRTALLKSEKTEYSDSESEVAGYMYCLGQLIMLKAELQDSVVWVVDRLSFKPIFIIMAQSESKIAE